MRSSIPLPSREEIQRLAREYGQECNAKKTRPQLGEMAKRLGRHSRWLTTNPTLTTRCARALVVREWIMLDCSAGIDIEPAPRTPQKEPAEKPAVLEDYPAGEDLYQVLQHPGRLQQFCTLAETAGIEGALRYAALVLDRHSAVARVG